METTLAKINEHGLTVAPCFGGVVRAGKPVRAAVWLAERCKVTFTKGMTAKVVKELAKDDATFKLARKEFDAHLRDYYRASGLANGALAADPNYRKELKMRVNKAGEPTGSFVTVYRPIAGVSTGPSVRELALEKELAELKALIAANA